MNSTVVSKMDGIKAYILEKKREGEEKDREEKGG